MSTAPRCPKCKVAMYSYGTRVINNAWCDYTCDECFSVRFFADTQTWIIDHVVYTSKEVERYKKLLAFI